MRIEITKYLVTLYSRPVYNSHIATIGLKNSSNRYVASIYFYAEGYTLPPVDVTGYIRMYFHINMFDSIVDLLRNESPVYLLISAGTAHIRTLDEPIGEEET